MLEHHIYKDQRSVLILEKICHYAEKREGCVTCESLNEVRRGSLYLNVTPVTGAPSSEMKIPHILNRESHSLENSRGLESLTSCEKDMS